MCVCGVTEPMIPPLVPFTAAAAAVVDRVVRAIGEGDDTDGSGGGAVAAIGFESGAGVGIGKGAGVEREVDSRGSGGGTSVGETRGGGSEAPKDGVEAALDGKLLKGGGGLLSTPRNTVLGGALVFDVVGVGATLEDPLSPLPGVVTLNVDMLGKLSGCGSCDKSICFGGGRRADIDDADANGGGGDPIGIDIGTGGGKLGIGVGAGSDGGGVGIGAAVGGVAICPVDSDRVRVTRKFELRERVSGASDRCPASAGAPGAAGTSVGGGRTTDAIIGRGGRQVRCQSGVRARCGAWLVDSTVRRHESKRASLLNITSKLQSTRAKKKMQSVSWW